MQQGSPTMELSKTLRPTTSTSASMTQMALPGSSIQFRLVPRDKPVPKLMVHDPPPALSRMSHPPLALTWKGGFILQEAVLSPLAPWQSFYVLIGAAAATLTGLMFVVVTLIAGVRVRTSSPGEAFATFNTPNVWHFGIALLVAVILSAPWHALWQAG